MEVSRSAEDCFLHSNRPDFKSISAYLFSEKSIKSQFYVKIVISSPGSYAQIDTPLI